MFLCLVARLIRACGGDVERFAGAALLLFRSSGIESGTRPIERGARHLSGCVSLSLEKKPAAKKSSQLSAPYSADWSMDVRPLER